MKRSVRLPACALILAVLLLFAASCGAKRSVSDDPQALSAALEDAGYPATFYLPGSAWLTSLEEEIASTLQDPPKDPMRGYLFAMSGDGRTLILEVFFFANARDAKKLYDHQKDGGQFGAEADLRRAGSVVYMGQVFALEIVENARDKNR